MTSVTIYRDIPRVSAGLIASLKGVGVADLHDVLPTSARDSGLVHHAIRPIAPGQQIAGQAVTAFCAMGDGLMSQCALYLSRPGDVLVLSSGGMSNSAVWGGNMALDAKLFGVAGVVVDGAVRDVATIREIQYPTWTRFTSPARPEKSGQGAVNVPISCGGVIVNPGDVVVADDDGILVIPPALVAAAVRTARQNLSAEADMQRKVRSGQRIFEVVKFDELLVSKGIEIRDGIWNGGDGDEPR